MSGQTIMRNTLLSCALRRRRATSFVVMSQRGCGFNARCVRRARCKTVRVMYLILRLYAIYVEVLPYTAVQWW